MSGVVAGLPAFLSALAGAGWPGVLAMVLGGFGLLYGVSQMTRMLNRRVDRADQAHAGADAGETAADLAGQAGEVTQKLEELRKKDPPVSSL
jgi:hypothetical protein